MKFFNLKTVLQWQLGFIIVLSLVLLVILIIHITMLSSFNLLTSVLINEQLPLQKQLIGTLNQLNLRIKENQAVDLQREAELYKMRSNTALFLGSVFAAFCIFLAVWIRIIMKRQSMSVTSE